MDDLGTNLAGGSSDMASEAALSTSADLRKRRSTRIVQAVPLQVTGVDALGRPFVERTSSLILNCHGCRYQSKHYVLKNMWVKLEVPNPDAEQPPRTVRGRVAWIQRPRTVRQLFQVALELETPGNVWGIGFPPEDWFAFKEHEKTQAAAAAATLGLPQTSLPTPVTEGAEAPPHASAHAQPAASETEFHVSLNEPEAIPNTGPDNVRVFPSPASATDASLQLARHVTRLLAEARQQIQATAREAAAQAVSAERRISADQWDQKVAEAREQLSQELAAAIEELQRESTERSRAAHEANAAALQEELPKRIAPQLEELTRNLSAKLSEQVDARRSAHELQLASSAETLLGVCKEAEEASARLRAATEQAQAEIAARSESARAAVEETARQREEAANAQRESISQAADEAQRQIAAAAASAQANWQSHLNAELEAAQGRWQITLENSLAASHQSATGAMSERADALVSALQQEAERHSKMLRHDAEEARAQSDQHHAGIRESLQALVDQMQGALARANEASERLDNFSARLETVQQQSLSGFQAQVDDVLSLHRNELHRRSESIFEEIAARIRGAFEESSQRAVAQFGQQIQALAQPEIAKTEEAMHRLAGGRSLLDAAVTLHQERIRATTDEAFGEALAQFRGNLASIEGNLRQSSEAVTSQALSGLEARVEGVKHNAVEDLIKSAEWYEKKAQTQIQAAGERIAEQYAAQIRDRANEISSEFSSDMDQSSRNFVSYAQTQMAEVVSDAFDKTRALFTEAAETTAAAFIDEIQRHARQDLDGFDEELRKSAADARVKLDAAHAELRGKLTADQESFLRRFQTEMSGALEAGVTDANQKVQAGFEPLLRSWKSMTEAHQSEMYEIYTRLGEQAAQQYRERLDNVSNQWMLATVTSLDHQSREAVAKIAVTAEEKLRETCAQVFADIGNALRERLQQIASNVNAATKGTTP
jgi:hypothetical protein